MDVSRHDGEQPVSPVLSVKGVCVDDAHGGARRLIDAVSFDVWPGEVVDLVGASGSGKSTLLLVVARLHPRAAGSMTLCGRSLDELSGIEWRQNAVYVPQKATMLPGSVGDNLLAPWKFACRRGRPAPDGADLLDDLRSVGLPAVGLDRRAEQLSGGEAARVALLRALELKAPLLLLDEVDAALDDESAALVGAFVAHRAEQGQAFVRVRHRPPDGFATRRLRLEGGRLLEEDVGVARGDDADCVCREELRHG